jgi:hypothetical protein
VTARRAGLRSGVEGGDHVLGGERPIGSALDVAPLGDPSPRQQVGVVLHDGGDHDIGGIQPEPIGEVIDGLGRVAAQDGHVGPVLVLPGEGEHGTSGLFVGCGRPARAETGPPVHARVPGQEIAHPVDHRRVGLGGGGLVEFDRPALDAAQAGDQLP